MHDRIKVATAVTITAITLTAAPSFAASHLHPSVTPRHERPATWHQVQHFLHRTDSDLALTQSGRELWDGRYQPSPTSICVELFNSRRYAIRPFRHWDDSLAPGGYLKVCTNTYLYRDGAPFSHMETF